MEAEKGGKFAFFGGNVSGEFKELVPGKKIVQYWRYKQWPDQHYSEVTFNIEEKVILSYNSQICKLQKNLQSNGSKLTVIIVNSKSRLKFSEVILTPGIYLSI